MRQATTFAVSLLVLSVLLLEVVVDGGVEGADVVDAYDAAASGRPGKSSILGGKGEF